MIEEFKKHHIKRCADIFFDIYKNEPFNYNWLEYSRMAEYFNDIFKTPGFRGFIILKNSFIIGACVGTISDYFKVKKYRINEIFIDRKFSGKGFGSELIQKIEKILLSEGIDVIELSTDRRMKAFDFYLKNKYSILENNVNIIKVLKNL